MESGASTGRPHASGPTRKSTVLVTGAGGTVGNYVVGLAEASGFRVIASDLTLKGLRQPVRGEVRPGDLRDRSFLERLVKGVDHVVHTAALLDVGTPAGALDAVNAQAVANLYDAASSAGARRFVHVSTAMVYATGQRKLLDESAALGARGPHSASKLRGEELLRERAAQGGPAFTILRPAPLYGRRGRHLAASLLAVGPVMGLTWPVLPRLRGGPQATLVHAEDVARAILHVLPLEETHGGTFNVADEEVLSLGERITETFHAYGLRTLPVIAMPKVALDGFGKLVHAPMGYQATDAWLLAMWKIVSARHRLKAALRPRIDREVATLFSDDLVIDPARLRALGWKPRFPRFAEGFRQVLRWYQAERWVPRYA